MKKQYLLVHFLIFLSLSFLIEFIVKDLNSPSCLPCPPHSKAPSASTSPAACACEFGTVQNSSGTLSCQCPEDKALVNSQAGAEHCASCQALHLLCPAGSKASTAKVLQGYARLQEPSEKVYKCLEAARCTSSGCAEGQDISGIDRYSMTPRRWIDGENLPTRRTVAF